MFFEVTLWIHQPYLISLFITTKKASFTFDAVVWPSKHQSYSRSNFQTSKYVRRFLVSCLFISKYVISLIFWIVTSNCISYIYVVVVLPRKTLFVLCLLTTVDFFHFLSVESVQKDNCHLLVSSLTSNKINGVLLLFACL